MVLVPPRFTFRGSNGYCFAIASSWFAQLWFTCMKMSTNNPSTRSITLHQTNDKEYHQQHRQKMRSEIKLLSQQLKPYLIVVVLELHLDIKSHKLSEMTVCGRLFRTEVCPNVEHFGESAGNRHLLVELSRLS